MSYNMEVMEAYFNDAIIPGSVYLWIVVVGVLCAYSLYKARKMVSEI